MVRDRFERDALVQAERRIYYDPVDDAMDGHGWNVVEGEADESAIAVRFNLLSEAEAYVVEEKL